MLQVIHSSDFFYSVQLEGVRAEFAWRMSEYSDGKTVESLEKVIERMLALAENYADEAQKSSVPEFELVADPVNPFDVRLPEKSAQNNPVPISPWQFFLWDSYRNCLEILCSNAQLEGLYHRIARKSLAFCAKYHRRPEFVKLCELLRHYLIQIQTHHAVNLISTESLDLLQETRLCQLDTAIQLEDWQEAHRSAVDVHGMLKLSRERDRDSVAASTSTTAPDMEISERDKASRMAEETRAREEEAKRVEEKKRLEQERRPKLEEKVKADYLRKLQASSFGMNILRRSGDTVIVNLDIDQVLKERSEMLDKAHLQVQERLVAQERLEKERQYGHWVRAMHLEEMQERRLLQDRYREEAPKQWVEFQEKIVAKAVSERARHVAVHAQLARVRDAAAGWMEDVKARHMDDFAIKVREWKQKLDDIRGDRLAERVEERKWIRMCEHDLELDRVASQKKWEEEYLEWYEEERARKRWKARRRIKVIRRAKRRERARRAVWRCRRRMAEAMTERARELDLDSKERKQAENERRAKEEEEKRVSSPSGDSRAVEQPIGDAATKTRSAYPAEFPEWRVGDRCSWRNDGKVYTARIRWIGYLRGHVSLYAGLEFDEPVGRGTVRYQGEELFATALNHAGFVMITTIDRQRSPLDDDYPRTQDQRKEKPAPPASGGGAWRPSRMRGEGGPAGSPGGQRPPPRDFGPRGRGQKNGHSRGDRDGDRRPQQRTQGGGASGGADSANWRR